MTNQRGCPDQVRAYRRRHTIVHRYLHSTKKKCVRVYSTVGCRRTWGRRCQPRLFLFFTTPANLVLIFQSVFESRWLACSAHTVGDDAWRAGNAAEMFQTVEVESVSFYSDDGFQLMQKELYNNNDKKTEWWRVAKKEKLCTCDVSLATQA